MKKIVVAMAALLAATVAARAADLPTKAPALSYQYPTTKCGLYYGVDTKGSTGSVSNAAVGTQMVQGAIGLNIGYTCPMGAGYWFVDADFDFANLNGSQNGLALSGPAVFEQRFGFGIPADLLMSVIPGLAALQNAVPSISKLPSGVTVVTSNPNVFLSTTWDDVGTQFGLNNFREFAFAMNFGVGNKVRMSNGVVFEPYAEYMIPSTQQCIGPSVVGGCFKEKNRVRVGMKLEF